MQKSTFFFFFFATKSQRGKIVSLPVEVGKTFLIVVIVLENNGRETFMWPTSIISKWVAAPVVSENYLDPEQIYNADGSGLFRRMLG